jgi:hypothetical protein
VGIQGNTYIGGNLNVTGNSNLLGNVILGIANLGNTYIFGGTTAINVIGSTTTILGVVNPFTLVDGSVLLTNTPPLDFSNNYGTVWTPTATSQNWYRSSGVGVWSISNGGCIGWIHVYFQQLRCDVDTNRHISKLASRSDVGVWSISNGVCTFRWIPCIFPAITVRRGHKPPQLKFGKP